MPVETENILAYHDFFECYLILFRCSSSYAELYMIFSHSYLLCLSIFRSSAMATRRPSNPAAGSALPAPSPTARRQSFGRASVVGALPIGSTRKSSAASLTGAATGAAAASDSSNVVVAPTSARRAVNRRSSIISDAVSKIIMPTRFPGR